MKKILLMICHITVALIGAVSAANALPKCMGEYTPSTWTKCEGRITFSNGNKYAGEFLNGLRHGKGTFTWATGAVYIGAFKNDKFHGKGTETNPNGNKYVGDFKSGKFNGKGTFSWADGTKYVGSFSDGERHGIGTSTWGRRGKYVGEWKKGKAHGLGITRDEYGKISEGAFKEGKFLYATKTPYSLNAGVSSQLKNAFVKLSKSQRKQIQSNLKDLGYYKSSIDGLYGKGTSGALTAYNKQNLNGADLNNFENVNNLISAVLGLKPAPKTVPDNNSYDTYKVASGTGFYVSEQGHIITNHHVIDGCQDVKVHSKGKVLETKKIADDKRNDLALLKISETPKHAFALNTESPFPLQEIVVAGYPFGDRVSSTLKFTQGVVSSLAGLGNDYSQIQIDAALQPGNSGGPILDEYGNVVAVAVAKLSLKKILKDYGVVPENTNFGVKASAVRNLMEGNGVPFKSQRTEIISKRQLSSLATDGTVFLSCWMTTAQIEQIKDTKVIFKNFE